MSALAVLLVAVGIGDLVRADDRGRSADRTGPALLVGLAALVLVSGLTGLSAGTGGPLLALSALVLTGWVLTTAPAGTPVATTTGTPVQAHEGRSLLPLGILGVGAVVLLALSGWAPAAGGLLARWLTWADLPWQPSPERALVVAGLGLLQLSTGNRLVRLVLVATGALPRGSGPSAPEAPTAATGDTDPAGASPGSALRPDEELKGGRLLGPMERLFILGLGLAGEYTAAGIVIAAKGLIRWPELRAHSEHEPGRIDRVTEYFLVGSFVSWLLALASLALAA